MDLQHKFCFSTKTTNFQDLNIFVDNEPIKVKKSKCIWYCHTGNHTIRIEQLKMNLLQHLKKRNGGFCIMQLY
jgi:hypothetical protein